MCWVMPPASPTATRALRMESSSEVLPWSTCPITVTTGGRDSSVPSSCDSARKLSGSSSFAGFATWPISATTIIAVSWSITWLMVTMEPIFIMTLMTSAAFTDILCARSPRVMVSGTSTSTTLGSAGAANSVAPSSSRWRDPRGPARQPPRPLPESPRVLIWRRLAASSTHAVAGRTAFFSGFLPALSAGFAVGRCSVPSGAAGFSPSAGFTAGAVPSALTSTSTGASASVAGASSFLRMTRFFFGASASAGFASAGFASAALAAAASSSSFLALATFFVFDCASAAWRAASSAWRLASASRLRNSTSLMTGAAGGGAFFSGSGTSTGFSTFTKVRFLRTSTWIVRALPVESARLISVVCLRVSVIFFVSDFLPCISCR